MSKDTLALREVEVAPRYILPTLFSLFTLFVFFILFEMLSTGETLARIYIYIH